MPFWVYQTSESADGVVYSNPQSVPLAGGGLIQTACRPFLDSQKFDWKVQESDLLRAGKFEPANHALVIDITPKRTTALLLRVRSIAGFSYPGYTPIMLICEALFLDEPFETKQTFTKETSKGIVRTVLYLKGGHASGSWNWGGNSRTTAALLFEEAWEHFKKVV